MHIGDCTDLPLHIPLCRLQSYSLMSHVFWYILGTHTHTHKVFRTNAATRQTSVLRMSYTNLMCRGLCINDVQKDLQGQVKKAGRYIVICSIMSLCERVYVSCWDQCSQVALHNSYHNTIPLKSDLQVILTANCLDRWV